MHLPAYTEQMTAHNNPDAARAAWQRLAEHGGITTRQQLADHWQVTQQRVAELAGRPDFPAPVARGAGTRPALWLTAEVERWRAAYIDGRTTGPSDSALQTPLTSGTEPGPAQSAWRSIRSSGGLTTAGDFAQRHELTPSQARRILTGPGTPEPIAAGYWLTAETASIYSPRYKRPVADG